MAGKFDDGQDIAVVAELLNQHRALVWSQRGGIGAESMHALPNGQTLTLDLDEQPQCSICLRIARYRVEGQLI